MDKLEAEFITKKAELRAAIAELKGIHKYATVLRCPNLMRQSKHSLMPLERREWYVAEG